MFDVLTNRSSLIVARRFATAFSQRAGRWSARSVRRFVVGTFWISASVIASAACSDATLPTGVPTDGVKGQTPAQTDQCSTLTAGAIVCPGLPTETSSRWRTVSAGADHTCGLRGDGSLFCWGGNRDGQLGVAPSRTACGSAAALFECSTAPVRSQSDRSFLAVSAGGRHTCAITTDRDLVCWGANDRGQLGSTAPSGATAALVQGNAKWVQVSAGDTYTCAVRVDGVVSCWGSNQEGELGIGTTQASTAPVAVALPEVALAVSAGQGHTCARLVSGAVYCWGAIWTTRSNDFELTRTQLTPELVPVSPQVVAVSVGAFTTCGVTRASLSVCWDANPRGELGNGTHDGSIAPVQISTDQLFAQISAGLVQTCGVTVSGGAFCWGDDSFGQLARDPAAAPERCDIQELPCSTTPLAVSGAPSFTFVSTGLGSHVCAVTTAGEIYCWGLGTSGQRGDGSTQPVQSNPTRILESGATPG